MSEKSKGPEKHGRNNDKSQNGPTSQVISGNQSQVSLVLNSGNGNQFTLEEKAQINDFLSAGKFLAEDFSRLPDKFLGKYLILRFIEIVGDGLSIVQNLDIFRGLDEETALKLIDAGEGWAVGKNIDRFHCQDYSNIVLKIIDEGEEESFFVVNDEGGFGEYNVIANGIISKLEGHINKNVALKLIEKGYEDMVIADPHIFQGLDSEIFFSLGGGRYPKMLEDIVWYNLSNTEIERLIEDISDIELLCSLGNGLYNGIENPPFDLLCKRMLNLIDEDPVNSVWNEWIMLTLTGNGYGSELLKRIQTGKNIDESFSEVIESKGGGLLKSLGNPPIELFLNIIIGLPKSLKLVMEGGGYLLKEILGSSSIEGLLGKLIKFPNLFDKIVAFVGDFENPINGELILKSLGNPPIEYLLSKGVEFPESFLEIIGNIPKIDVISIAPRIIKNDSTFFKEFSEYHFNGMKLFQQIYPLRNYSLVSIHDYSDQSQHLSKYIFNSEGYTFTLSNLLGYKLKEGMEMDKVLLQDYKTRVVNITKISRDTDSLSSALDNLAQVHGISLESKGLESRILEFLLKKQEHTEGITKADFDILIAYQLMGRFEQFIKNSNDKLATSTDPETIHIVQILALLQEYGDPLKESVRRLEKIALKKEENGNNTPDATLLLKKFGRDTPKEVIDLTKDRIMDSMIRSFSQRPEHAITDSVVQKSILEKCKSVLQQTSIPQEEQEEFAKSFSIQDFIGLSDINKQEEFKKKWKQQVEESFGRPDTLGLNLRSVAKTQQSIYSTLQVETQKFEEIVDKNGLQSERHVFARFGKNKYDALARGVGDICLGTDEGMWKNPEYFELVLFDTDRLKCIGTVMLLNMLEPDGKKYLLYGPNPSVEFDDKVSSFKLFDQLSRIVIVFAQANNFDGVVFDPEHGRSTNRSGDFQTALEQSQLKGNDGEIIQIDLKKDHLLGKGGGQDYEYRQDLSFLWIKS